ncbi:MAG TPA: MOP flippase family protein [Oscillatoriaceae cyanobacterium]
MANLFQASLSGVRWSALSQLCAQGMQYVSFVWLARLLSPSDFGTVATATLAVGLLSMLNELGLGAALIQRPDLRPGHLNAGFWSNVAVGLALWAGLVASASALAGFFHNAAVAPILAALGASFPVVGLAVVPKALLERALRFKALGLADALAAIANALFAIALALRGAGAWSLVVGTLAGYAVQAIVLYAACRWRPGWRFGRGELAALFGFGASVLGSRLLSYASANVDYLMIGRVLGPGALGAYSLAYKLVTWPMLKISHVTLRVAYPAFARLQEDQPAFRAAYAKLVATLALATFPLLTGLALLAPQLIPLVFGAGWTAAVGPTQVLCLAGLLKALVCSIGTVFMSRGRPDLELKLNLAGLAVLALSVGLGVRSGILGVAIAVAASTLVGAPVQQVVALKLIGLRAGAFLEGLRAPFLATLALALALGGWIMIAMPLGLPAWGVLAGGTLVGALIYPAMLSLLGFDWLRLARHLAGRRAAPAA